MRPFTPEHLALAASRIAQDALVVRGAGQSKTLVEFRKLKSAGHLVPAFLRHWYIVAGSDQPVDVERDWPAYYWEFIHVYCQHRFGDEWCLSPEASLAWWAEDRSPPTELTIRSPKANNQRVDLGPAGSLFLLRTSIGEAPVRREGQLIMTREAALLSPGAEKWVERAVDCVSVLGSFKDGNGLGRRIRSLLNPPRTNDASRVAGALAYLGKHAEAEAVEDAMRRVFHLGAGINPFDEARPHAALESGLAVAPAETRVRMLWLRFREQLLQAGSAVPAAGSVSPGAADAMRDDVEGIVSGISRWSTGAALDSEASEQLVEALAVDVNQIAYGTPVHLVVQDGIDLWQAWLAPQRAGWRTFDVCFPYSRHIPIRPPAIKYAMKAFHECMAEEPLPWVRALVAPLVLQVISPYADANGRVARLLGMMLRVAAGAPHDALGAVDRQDYIQAIERASTTLDAGDWFALAGRGL